MLDNTDVLWSLWCCCGAQTDDPLLVQQLIVFGADVNALNDGESPRHKAATTGSKNRL